MPEQGFYKQQATDFFKQWEVSYQALCDSFREYFTEGCVWINDTSVSRAAAPDTRK